MSRHRKSIAVRKKNFVKAECSVRKLNQAYVWNNYYSMTQRMYLVAVEKGSPLTGTSDDPECAFHLINFIFPLGRQVLFKSCFPQLQHFLLVVITNED